MSRNDRHILIYPDKTDSFVRDKDIDTDKLFQNLLIQFMLALEYLVPKQQY